MSAYGSSSTTVSAATRDPIAPAPREAWKPDRRQIAEVLLSADINGCSSDFRARMMARVPLAKHLGTPPCKVPMTCEACMWEDWLQVADAILALGPDGVGKGPTSTTGGDEASGTNP